MSVERVEADASRAKTEALKMLFELGEETGRILKFLLYTALGK